MREGGALNVLSGSNTGRFMRGVDYATKLNPYP